MNSDTFVIEQFETQGYRFFDITDDNGDIVYSQNDNIDEESALFALKKALRDISGTNYVRVYKRKLGDINNRMSKDKNQIAKFHVTKPSAVVAQSMSGIPNMPAQNNYNRSNSPDPYDLTVQLAGVQQQMLLMAKDHQHYREMKELQDKISKLEDEQTKSKGMGAIVDRMGEQFSDPAVLMGLISGVSKIFTKPQMQQPIMAMNGVDDEVDANIKRKKNKVVIAVNRLMELDSNFAEHIEQLSILAKNKPQIYEMAISYLKTL
jgi:hypothetical protein